jgi:adenosylcobinamide-GDP ribazoletransferase
VNTADDTLTPLSRQLQLALHRFTRVRPRAADDHAAGLLRASLGGLPAIGWASGIVAVLVFVLVSIAIPHNGWGPAVAAVASTMATALLTGAIHERGCARAIARLDARAADAATVGLTLLLAAKIVLLAALATASGPAVLSALLSAHVVSRYAPLLVADWLGAPAAVQRRVLRRAVLWCVVPLAILAFAAGIAALLVALLAAALACFALVRAGGKALAPFDEEALGVVQQACEVAFYFGVAIAAA